MADGGEKRRSRRSAECWAHPTDGSWSRWRKSPRSTTRRARRRSHASCVSRVSDDDDPGAPGELGAERETGGACCELGGRRPRALVRKDNKGRIYLVKVHENGHFKESSSWKLEDLASVDMDGDGQVTTPCDPAAPAPKRASSPTLRGRTEAAPGGGSLLTQFILGLEKKELTWRAHAETERNEFLLALLSVPCRPTRACPGLRSRASPPVADDCRRDGVVRPHRPDLPPSAHGDAAAPANRRGQARMYASSEHAHGTTSTCD